MMFANKTRCLSQLVTLAFCCVCFGAYAGDGSKAVKDVKAGEASKAVKDGAAHAASSVNEYSGRIVLRFPEDKPVGKLSLMRLNKSRELYGEETYALAQGDVIAPQGSLFLLEVNFQGARDLGFLKKLPDEAIGGFRSTRLQITDKQFEEIVAMTRLKVLNISDADITDKSFMHVRQCKGLNELRLDSSGITGKGLAALRDLPQIASLTLDQNELDDASMVNLAGLKNLVALRLKAAGIGDAGIAQIKKLPLLRKLIVSGNKRITDASIPHFLAITKLKKLDVTDSKISAAGLMKLKDLSKLKFLEFAFKDYTVGQIDQIRRAMPSCKVIDGRDSTAPDVMFAPLHY